MSQRIRIAAIAMAFGLAAVVGSATAVCHGSATAHENVTVLAGDEWCC